jgi:hypothetical protein
VIINTEMPTDDREELVRDLGTEEERGRQAEASAARAGKPLAWNKTISALRPVMKLQ